MSGREKQYVALNNQLRETLNQENKQYYENILVYMRTHLFTDGEKTEEILYELLTDMIDAQAEGLTAEQFFGKNPKELCDSIIKEIPRSTLKEKLEMVFGIGFVLLQFFLYNALFAGEVELYFVQIAGIILCTGIAIYGIIKYVGTLEKANRIFYILLIVLGGAGGMLFFLINHIVGSVGPSLMIRGIGFDMMFWAICLGSFLFNYRSGYKMGCVISGILIAIWAIIAWNPYNIREVSPLYQLVILMVFLWVPMMVHSFRMARSK